MAYVRVGNLEVFFEAVGTGRPLVFIHDWNTSSALFRRINLPMFVREYRVVLIDLPGFGKSGRADVLSFELFSTIIEAVCGELGIAEFDLMGFCLGAVISLDYAIRHPGTVRRLVLLEPIIDFPFLLSVLFLPVIGPHILHFFSKTRKGQSLFLRFMWGENRFFRKIFLHSVRTSRETVSREYLKLLHEYSVIDHYRRSRSLGCRTVIVTGERTPALISRCARKLARNIPLVRRIVLPGVRHFVLLEDPDGIFQAVGSP